MTDPSQGGWRRLALASLLLLGACAGTPDGDAPDSAPQAVSPLAANPWTAEAPWKGGVALWQHQTFPGKQPSRYRYDRKDGRDAMQVSADASASALRHRVRIPAAELGRIRFSWRVPELIAGADMALRDAEDAPVRLVLVFDGDRSRFSARNAMLSELSQSLTGEPLPYATLMYVWCNTRSPDSVIVNPRTDRIRKIVVESGAGNLDRWLDYQRDVAADYRKAFGEPPGDLLAVGIMTDTDNTRSRVQAWYGPIRLIGR
ncbi:MAG: DUF3047 domain-containing protein [Rhodoferax sp.]|nr:DUF3047 domain-containing protein [Rhodoferax sp.]